MKRFKIIYVPEGTFRTETMFIDAESKPNVLRIFNLGSVVSITEEAFEVES